MAYSKQTWDTTSIFNPTRMNHIEDGIEGADTKTADDIPYSSGVSVKDKIDDVDGKTADDIPYSTGVSVKDKIEDVESKLAWKLVGVITTTTSQNIPTGASEILVVACNHNQGTAFGSMVVPTDNMPLVLALPYNSTDLLALNRSGTTLSFLDTTKTDRVARLYYR